MRLVAKDITDTEMEMILDRFALEILCQISKTDANDKKWDCYLNSEGDHDVIQMAWASELTSQVVLMLHALGSTFTYCAQPLILTCTTENRCNPQQPCQI